MTKQPRQFFAIQFRGGVSTVHAFTRRVDRDTFCFTDHAKVASFATAAKERNINRRIARDATKVA